MLDSQAIRSFFTSQAGVDLTGLGDDDPIFSSSVADSFVMVDLLAFVEERTGILFDPDDVSLDNLDTIASVLAYVASRA